ncbi:class I SAM-dependent methyltransferase [Actinosynnema sp. NPDC050801]|uniref:class I SAM-dependent methyltransferase n=1 Tax=unclassified Actinosynnema TaxID=2637065 RepID=UPI0033C43C3C
MTEPPYELDDMRVGNLADVFDRISAVLRRGVHVQLLTEHRATMELLHASHIGQRARVSRLFDGVEAQALSTNDNPDVALAWIAYSYTCEYTELLVEHPQPTGAGLPGEPHLMELRKRAMETVTAQRTKLLVGLPSITDALFAGTDKKVSELFKFRVTEGRSAPPKLPEGQLPAALDSLRQNLAQSTFTPVSDDDWSATLGVNHKILRVDTSGSKFDLGGIPVVRVEGVLDPKLTQKTVTGGRVVLGDGTSRAQVGGNFVGNLVSQRRLYAGDQVEYDTSRMALNLAGDAHWQGKAADWRIDKGGNRRTYYAEVHPKIAQYLLSVVPPERDAITVLDIAGGNGDLAERIIRELGEARPQGDLRVRYVVVDYSEDDIVVAKERFAALAKSHPFAKTTALVQDMFQYGYDAAAMLDDVGLKAADFVINSGGLLNNQIGDDTESPRRFARMYANLLAPGGYGIYSGLTPLLVNSATHREHGLEIRNLYDIETEHQVHVVRRPA